MLRPLIRWFDEGYAYTVVCTRTAGELMLDVSRVLAAGRMSPLVGRKSFPVREEPVLGAILGAGDHTSTMLVDEIIRGESLSLGEFLRESTCEVNLGH